MLVSTFFNISLQSVKTNGDAEFCYLFPKCQYVTFAVLEMNIPTKPINAVRIHSLLARQISWSADWVLPMNAKILLTDIHLSYLLRSNYFYIGFVCTVIANAFEAVNL